MKEIVVISGKGGTGKTSVMACFAALAENPVLADCDVDAADLHLVLSPEVAEEHEFSGGKNAQIIENTCSGCGKCYELCRYNAINETTTWDSFPKTSYTIDPVYCEGCGVCAWFCPEKAIDFKEAVNGKWFISDTRFGPMVHAKLGIAEENSGKLVTIVKNQAKKIAEERGRSYVIVDGSPGIGCPVIASLTGANLVVIVTEPSLSGAHDLERVADLTKHFNIPTVVCVNKYDINPEITNHIEEKANSRSISTVGNIRYDRAVTDAQIMKTTVVEYTNAPVSEDIKKTWQNVLSILHTE